MSRGAALLIEGQCPNGHGALERRESWGFCAGCGHLWRIRGDVLECAVEVTADFTEWVDVTDRVVGEPTITPGREGTSG